MLISAIISHRRRHPASLLCYVLLLTTSTLLRAMETDWEADWIQRPGIDAPADLNTLSWQLTTADGNQLGLHFIATDANPSAIILYLPGTHMNSRSLLDNLDQNTNLWLFLARQQFTIYGLDYRSHFIAPDASPAQLARMADWGLETYVADAISALHLIRTRHPDSPVFILAFSRGVSLGYGLLCQTEQLRHRPQGLIALDGGFKLPMRGASETYEVALAAFNRQGDWALDVAGRRGWEARAQMLEGALAGNADALADLRQSLYRSWGPGILANPGELSDPQVLAHLLAGYDRYYPALQSLQARLIATSDQAPHTALDDCWGRISQPILAVASSKFAAIAPGILYSAQASGSADVSLIELAQHGHLDVLVGRQSLSLVYQPVADWIRRQLDVGDVTGDES